MPNEEQESLSGKSIFSVISQVLMRAYNISTTLEGGNKTLTDSLKVLIDAFERLNEHFPVKNWDGARKHLFAAMDALNADVCGGSGLNNKERQAHQKAYEKLLDDLHSDYLAKAAVRLLTEK